MYRRTIPELINLYELEPEIRDVWVEGPSDKSIYSWFFNETVSKRVDVKVIDEANVGSEILEKYGLSSGNKQRVIALAFELDSALRNSECATYTAIADKDSDEFQLSTPYTGSLVYTDFTSVELYFFDEVFLQKFFTLCLGLDDIDINQVMAGITNAGEELFFFRLASERLSLSLKWVPIDRLLSCNERYVEINAGQLCDKLMQKNKCWFRREEFLSQVENIRANKKSECRNQINGHDFVKLLHWPQKKAFGALSGFERALRGCLEVDYVRQFRLFSVLEERFQD